MKITSKGQVTIPQHIRDCCGWTAGTEVEFVFEDKEVVVREHQSSSDDDFEAWLKEFRGSGQLRMSTGEYMKITRGED